MKRPGRINSAIRALLRLDDYSGWEGFAVSNAAGQNVNTTNILQLSTVWACVRLISETIGTLPLGMYERTSAGKKPAPQHDLDSILGIQPNIDSIASVFWEAVVAAMLLRGNAYCEKLMAGNRVIGLEFLYPSRLNISRSVNNQPVFIYTGTNGHQRQIDRSRIWQLPGWSLDGKSGVSVVAYGAEVFGAALATDTAASSTFKNGLRPTTWFKYPKILKENQRKEARELIENRLSGSINSGKSVILEADMEVGTIGIPPKDAQLLESRAFSVEELCRWFRVPPWMVGHTEKSTSWGSGIEQQMIGFLTFTLSPWLKRIEQSIVKDLLSPADRLRFYPKFKVEGLLRSDSAGRSAFYSTMVNNGIYTRDEVRELEDKSPMGGNASVLTVQTALTPIDELGKNNQRALSAVEAVQKAYLGVGKMITADEARTLVNNAGADLKITGPDFPDNTGANK